MIAEKDFSHLSRFPGETGNLFDVILHKLVAIEKIPSLIFGGLLLLIAAIPSRLNLYHTLILWAFFLADWILIAFLPRFQRSFGPAKPVVLILSVLRALLAWLPFPWYLILEGMGSLLVLYGFWIEPHHLTVTHEKLETSKLPENSELRVLHLGDLHIERISHRERALQAWIDRLEPDVIVFSGDILNLSYRNDPTAMQQARQVISQWHAPLGVYLVNGSPAVDLAENMPNLMEGLPVRWLRDEKTSLEKNGARIDLIGITCSHRPHVDGPKLEALLPGKPEHFTLLAYHSPDLAPVASRLGVDLQFSGHTHGGQVRIPGYGAIVTASLYGKVFEAGRVQVGPLTLYVTRGIGMEGAGAPRVRLFCPPEIILWEIKGRPS